MTEERIRKFINSVTWKFAKTMPENPHEYTLKMASPKTENEFLAFVIFIREHGTPEKFFSKTFMYYYIDGWKYWTMGSPLDQTILINRAKA